MNKIQGFSVWFVRGGKLAFSAFFLSPADAQSWADTGEYIDRGVTIVGGEVHPMEINVCEQLESGDSTASPQEGRGG